MCAKKNPWGGLLTVGGERVKADLNNSGYATIWENGEKRERAKE